MARLLSCSASLIDTLTIGWECTSTPPNAAAYPSEVPDNIRWFPARVPGTFAAALRDADEWNGEPPLELDHRDIWYRVRFSGGVDETLLFQGLATIADIWLNGEHLRRSENMFLPCSVAARTLATNDLHICFRSLAQWLGSQRGRARWRTRIATPGSLRFARTALLGRMPGWCPTVHPVGPWRPVQRKRCLLPYDVRAVDARASVVDGDGHLALRCTVDGDLPRGLGAIAEIGSASHRLDRISEREFTGEIVIPRIPLWWPHTHGRPHLHHLRLRLGDADCDLGHIGFRTIEVDRGIDGSSFALRVNGQPIFCRGACWTTPNIVTLPCDTVSYRPWLEAMRDAGANMVRVGGTMLYEADDFYALCDELGLLVWQDAILANFDYPTTETFLASLTAELEHFLHRTQLNACFAMFCGGSEVIQQAAMFGVPKDKIDDTLYQSVIPDVLRRIRPELAYVSNSPSGDDLPFLANSGVTHYYGVGAYCRPLDDARRAGVRFASECLAIAHVPCARTIEELGISTTTDPRWKQSVPRDPGASWDFEDIRDHYLATLFKVDPLRLRYTDFGRYLEVSRAVSCILIEETFNEWRRLGSTCRGGLVWQWQDVQPGAGWGLMDSHGRRKPAWYALQRACRTQQIMLTDEGLNGLAVHIVNEADAPLRAVLRLACLKHGVAPLREAEQTLTIGARSALCLRSAALLPAFFDITYAYRFGPLAHDVTVALLHDEATGRLIAEACHFPDLASLQPHDIGLEVMVEHGADEWSLRLRSTSFAQFLHIDDHAFTASENWLHLAPGHERRITLLPDREEAAVPQGEIRALNMDRVVRYAEHE